MPEILFKKSIKLIEIEVFSYCNRQCWHCPNSIIDRHSKNIYMSDDIYEKIIKNLQQINYNNIISFSRYNEPLSNDIIFKRIKQALLAVPNAILHLNTNGDFLIKEVLHKLYISGLRSLNIQIYAQNDNHIHQKINNKLNSLNLNGDIIRNDTNKIEISGNYNKMRFSIYYRNFKKTGVNRGGIIQKLIKKEKRIVPCLIPSKWVCIDYNGSVMPCCNLRSDWNAHKSFILGDLNDNNQNLFTIFNNKKAKSFRKLLASNELKPYPCNICHFSKEKLNE